MVRSLLGLLVLSTPCALAACAPAAAPCPASPAAPVVASTPPPAAPSPSAAAPAVPDADLVVLLRPATSPSPAVHVELTVARGDAAPASWRIARGAPERIARAVARDAAGEVSVEVTAAAPAGVSLRLARPVHGVATLAYDVLAGDDAPDDPLGLLVLDDRFRGSGERLVAVPEGSEDARATVLLRIDGEALRASGAASSFGVGPSRRTTATPRALRHATFVAGSLGVQVIDDPAGGHDEGAWLGYTAFDPRPVVAELAQVRSALREMFRSAEGPAWTHLFVSQTRPIGSFTSTPRWQSELLQVGPAEPWSPPLRLSMAQQLARLWIGGVLRVATEPGHEAEGGWFSEGVSRWAATRLLEHVGLLEPGDVRDAVAGELSVLATSPYRAAGNASLSELSRTDPVARATLMARGALYALRESAALRARTRGERGLDAVLAAMVRQAEDRKQPAFPVSAWLDALGKDDPDAARTFDALVVRGEPVVLPGDALGPCFRAGTGDYVAYDAGFDVEATRVSRDGRVVGVRPGGPAARAGLRDGDVVESMRAREGEADVPVKLVVERAGAKVDVTYAPRGTRGRGQTWTRLRQVPDDRCGEMP